MLYTQYISVLKPDNREILRIFLFSQKQKIYVLSSLYLTLCLEKVVHGLSAGLISTFVPEHTLNCICRVSSLGIFS